jgi:hypothetical protein
MSIIQAAANLNPSLLVLGGTEFLVNKDALGEESLITDADGQT